MASFNTVPWRGCSQRRAFYTEDDGPTFVHKPVVHEKIFTIFVPKTDLFNDTFTLSFFFDLMENLLSGDVCPENR